MALEKYNEKRNFTATPEPAGKASKKNHFRFVVQRHDASRLHYDFRLELDGVLKSWAVPKGPSLNPKDKRLAMMVEDHPVGYITFQGTIPEGNYGAGTVVIWDSGPYIPVNEKHEKISEAQAIENLDKGQLKFAMKGNKLKGEFVLVKLKGDAKGNSWLLIKHRDEGSVDTNYNSEDYVQQKSGQNAGPQAAIKQAATKTSGTNKPASNSKSSKKEIVPSKKKTATETKLSITKRATLPAKKIKYTDFYKPMLATLVDEPFDDKNWVFELKWDGYRAIADWKKSTLKLYSRNGISFSERFPVVAYAIKKLRKDVVLDGEIVLMNEEDKPDFQKLQHYEDNDHLPLLYYVFDILFLNGKDMRTLPLLKRKELLQKLLPEDDPVLRYCDHFEEHGRDFFKMVSETDMEGIIAKKADSVYICGVRTKDWLKIKHHHSREAVIIGYTAPRGAREHFGALVLAQYENGGLKYIGHTGTGFDNNSLKHLWKQMQPLVTSSSPLKEKIKVNSPVSWLKPKLVCQVNFTEETEGGMLRHPVFQGLRIDKESKEVQKKDEMPKKTNIEKNDRPATNEDDKTAVIDKRKVTLTNLTKIYWPNEKITKGDLINYYEAIAPLILAYLKDRPLSLKRNPNGIMDAGFFHKDAGEAAPSWVTKVDIFSESSNKIVHYIICNDKASLLYVVNLGCIELNPWTSTTKKLDNPTYLVIDLDPSDKNGFDQVIETAQVVRTILEKAGAIGYCKTSGASGLHVYIPLGGKYTFDEAKDFGKIIATRVQQTLPGITSVERSLKKRGDNIYIDFLQNRKGQTLASAYSVRPKPGAPVSTPLEWKEVKPGLHPSQFTIHNIAERIKRKGDLFEGVLKKGIDLKKCLKALG